MRASLLAALAGLALAHASEPQKVVLTRVFPQPGQIGLFVAAADGSHEHPLVTPADIDYDAAWALDGTSIVRAESQGTDPLALGRSLACEVLDGGGRALLDARG